MLVRLPKLKFLITTLGKKGSVLVVPTDSQEAAQEAAQEAVLEDLLHSMLEKVASSSCAADGGMDGSRDGSRSLGCTARNGTHIG